MHSLPLGELQPRDGVDGLRRVRPAVLRGAQPGTRAGHLQQGEPQGHRGQRGRTGKQWVGIFLRTQAWTVTCPAVQQ